MITTVTLNPAIDRTVVVEAFVPGTIIRVRSSREDMGGKGINVARILQSLGSDARATGFIGSRNFSHARSLLERDKIAFDLVQVPAETRQNTKLIEISRRVTTDINESGFTVSTSGLAELKAVIEKYAVLSEYVVFSGSIPPGLASSIYQELIAALPVACRPVLDADGEALLLGLTAQPYLLKPNIHELENALGWALPTPAAIVEASRELIKKHRITYVLVSMGSEGSILVTGEQALFAAPLKVDVKGTVGAGDAMLAGFIHSLASGSSDREALACATACGALAVSKEGTEAISKADVTVLAGQVRISAIFA